MSSNRYVFLDAIRGLAALFVVIRHTELFWGIQFYRSYLAVDVFFLLSGFVIAHAYEQRLVAGSLSAGAFFKNRLIRLYPMFLLSVILSLIAFFVCLVVLKYYDYLAALTAQDMFFLIVPVLFFLPSNYSGRCDFLFPINGPYWSLLDELLVNLLYVLIRPSLHKRMLFICIGLSGFGLCIVLMLNGYADLGGKDCLRNWGGGLFRAMFGFFVGLTLYRYGNYWAEVLKKSISPWAVLLLIALVFMSPSLIGYDLLIDMALILVFFPIAVLASQGHSSRYEKHLLILGRVSYPLYVLHWPIANLLLSVAGYSIYKHAPISGFVLIFLLIGVSLIVERYYEVPVRKYLVKRFIAK